MLQGVDLCRRAPPRYQLSYGPPFHPGLVYPLCSQTASLILSRMGYMLTTNCLTHTGVHLQYIQRNLAANHIPLEKSRNPIGPSAPVAPRGSSISNSQRPITPFIGSKLYVAERRPVHASPPPPPPLPVFLLLAPPSQTALPFHFVHQIPLSSSPIPKLCVTQGGYLLAQDVGGSHRTTTTMTAEELDHVVFSFDYTYLLVPT